MAEVADRCARRPGDADLLEHRQVRHDDNEAVIGPNRWPLGHVARSRAARARQARELRLSGVAAAHPDRRASGQRQQHARHDRAADPSLVDRAFVGRCFAESLRIEPVAAMSGVVAVLEQGSAMVRRG
ncbi:hypothetical protein chiPu_0033952, partial [Chiloscyllium punctatum]|nr:hypothetical protein [Chiloscyllium punctatum]